MDEIIKIQKNLEIIEKYLSILEEFNISSLGEFEEQTHDYLAISMSLFTLLNACIEIREEIISLKNLPTPLSYREIFKILEEHNIITKNISKQLSNAMYQRNMIAHQYDEVDISSIYEFYNKKKVFIYFSNQIKKIINK